MPPAPPSRSGAASPSGDLRITSPGSGGSCPFSRWERVGVRAGGGGGRATLLKPARQVTQRSPLGEHPNPLPLGETERGRGRGIPPNLSRRGSTLSLAADRAVFALRVLPLPRAALPPTLAPTYELRLTYGTERDVDPIEIVGFTAAALGAGALFPQVRQSWRTRSTGDLNLRTFLTILVSIALFLAYGAAIGSPSVITANAVAGVMVLSLVYLKLRHG